MNKYFVFFVLAFVLAFFGMPMGVESAEDHNGVAVRLQRITPISFVTATEASQLSTQAESTVDATETSSTTSNSITLSTYIFVLLTILSCMVGSVFSFICCKLVNSDRKI